MGLLSAAILAGFGIWAGEEEKRFERAAASEIAGRLSGDGKRVSVNVRANGLGGAWGDLSVATITAADFSLKGLPLFTEPERPRSGKVGTLQLRLSDFVLGGLRVESLSADIPDCRYDFGLARREKTIRLSESGVGTGSVRIREQDLADYIVRKFGEIKRCTVKVEKGFVWVEGYGEFLVVKSDFTVIAKIGVVDGTQLMLTDAKIYFDWRRADGFAAEALLKSLNPVVDLRKDLGLYDAVTVEKVRLEEGVLEATGRTKIPVKPTENQ